MRVGSLCVRRKGATQCESVTFAQQDAGYSAGELRAAGFAAGKMMVRIGLSKQGLYDVKQLLHAGYAVEELRAAGFQVEQGGQAASEA